MVSVWVTNAWRSDFVYDGKMRRRIRTEYTWNGSIWATNQIVRYVYDGNLVIQERDGIKGSVNEIVMFYLCQGAG